MINGWFVKITSCLFSDIISHYSGRFSSQHSTTLWVQLTTSINVCKIIGRTFSKGDDSDGLDSVLSTAPHFDSPHHNGQCSSIGGICGVHYHPSDPFLFREFFQRSLFPFWKFSIFNSSSIQLKLLYLYYLGTVGIFIYNSFNCFSYCGLYDCVLLQLVSILFSICLHTYTVQWIRWNKGLFATTVHANVFIACLLYSVPFVNAQCSELGVAASWCM